MLFYTSLLLTSLLITVILLAVYNLAVRVYKKVTASRHKIGPTSHLTESKYGKNVMIASLPWGHPQSHAQPSDLACTHPAKPEGLTPWGWPGNHHEHREPQGHKLPEFATLSSYLTRTSLGKNQTVDDWKHNVGRPERDDRPALAGTAYKPTIVNFPDLDSDDI